MDSPIAAGGLLLDIAGALILAAALILSSQERRLAQAASSGEMSNERLDIALAEQTADAYVGATLLTLGFLAQFDQALDWNPDWATLGRCLGAAVALIAAGVGLLLLVLRPYLVREALRARLDDYATQDERYPTSGEWATLRLGIYRVAEACGRPMVPGDRFDAAAAALIGERRWNAITSDRDVSALSEQLRPGWPI